MLQMKKPNLKWFTIAVIIVTISLIWYSLNNQYPTYRAVESQEKLIIDKPIKEEVIQQEMQEQEPIQEVKEQKSLEETFQETKKKETKIDIVKTIESKSQQFFSDDSDYITPNDKMVQSKLSELTNGDYSEANFGKNLKEIYYYVTNIRYEYDSDKWNVLEYWQTSDQTIEDGTGDCEDHAILLQSLIEALLEKTYGYIPKEVAYVIVGCVDTNYDGKQDGCHAWNIIDASKLPEQAYTLSIFDTEREEVPDVMNVIVGDVTINDTPPEPKEVVYEPSKDKTKTTGLLAVYWEGRKWVELESTWGMPLSYYENKGYPFTSVYRAFNSQENYLYPDFVGKEKKPIIFQDLIAYLYEFLRDVYQYVVDFFNS